jgi:hypothetical protein
MPRPAIAVVLLLILTMVVAASAAERLDVHVWPAISRAPAVIRIQVRVAPNAENRALEIAVESGEYYRSSVVPLEGADAARIHVLEYRSLPAGRYDVQVGLRTSDARLGAFARERIEVVQ